MKRWWRSRTLQERLSLLVTGAVAVAVLAVAAVAFTAVAQIQRRQVESQLSADAQSIAGQPDRWRGLPPDDRRGPRGPRNLGPHWQVLNRDGTVISQSAETLPVSDAAREVAAGRVRSVQERIRIGDENYLMLTVPASGGGAVQVAVDDDPTRNTLTVFGILLGVASLVGIAGAALLGRAVARAGLRPVQRLTDAVESVAATGDLARPIPADGVDEIARLGRSVNTMLTAIETSRRAQRSLVEDAGHELRTPLTSIRTNIELLLSVERRPELAHRLPPDERERLLRDLEVQLGELTTLTTELVELAREETTREAVEPVELADVVAAAVERVRARAPGATFAAELASAVVAGRSGELERMAVNILDNAAKWGRTVTVTLTGDGVLTVTDDGPGIDEADRPYVFDRFYRAPAARGTPGSGLGLAIVAQTVASHGGTVSVAPGVDSGTVVEVRLPLSH